MSDTPINLSRYRKAKARDDKRKQADANAAKFGRSKAEKAAQDAARDKIVKLLDGHRRDDADDI